MKTSQKGIDLIKNFEGCRLDAYKCPAGVWTIGYGHTGNVHKGMAITQEAAEAFLREDLVKFELKHGDIPCQPLRHRRAHMARVLDDGQQLI